MAEMTQQKQVTTLLIVVAALLAGIIGLLVWQANAVPAPSVSGTTSQGTITDPAMTNNTAVPAAAPAFDPATAPRVAADQTPEQYVATYYQLCQDGEYDSAFVMLPTSTQANSYGDSASFAAQVGGYGITGYEVGTQVEQDGNMYVVGTQIAPQMPISYTWTFVPADDGTWMCASRDMGGM